MLSELAATVVKQSEMPASPDSPTNKTELADHMWKALRHAQRTVYFIGQDDAKLMNFKISEMHGQGDIQDQSYTFRIQIPSQMYQKTVSGVRKTMQNGGLCVVIKDGDSSTMYVHSSIPGDAQQQMLKNMNIDVQVENQAIFFFNCLGLSQSDEESKIQNTFNCQAVLPHPPFFAPSKLPNTPSMPCALLPATCHTTCQLGQTPTTDYQGSSHQPPIPRQIHALERWGPAQLELQTPPPPKKMEMFRRSGPHLVPIWHQRPRLENCLVGGETPCV